MTQNQTWPSKAILYIVRHMVFLWSGVKEVSILEHLQKQNELSSKVSFIITDSLSYIFTFYII